MKSNGSLTAIIAVEVIGLCACIALLGALVVGAGLTGAVPFQGAFVPPPTGEVVSSPTRGPTGTAAPTFTPAPTYTRVLPPLPPNVTSQPGVFKTPTARPPAYKIPEPTLTVAPMVYPIAYTSTLVVSTYSVTGNTAQALSDSLAAHARTNPAAIGGEFFAVTDPRVSIQYLTHPTAKGCELEKASITLAITVTLPLLAEGQTLPADLKDRWTKFVDNTITHESGHVKIIEQDARRIQRDLGNVAPASNCDVLEASLDDMLNKAKDTSEQDNHNYDSQTNHGETQGAVFP